MPKKGYKQTPEHIKKHLEAIKGSIPWNKGMKMSKEFGEKIRQANLSGKCGMLGRHHKLETIEKIRKGNWTIEGGITKKQELDRTKFKKTIQKQVLERDKYTCQICGKFNGILHVDHIQPFAEYVEGRFCMDNCRTLCRECHYNITFGKPIPKNSTWGLITSYKSIKQYVQL